MQISQTDLHLLPFETALYLELFTLKLLGPGHSHPEQQAVIHHPSFL